MENNLVIQEDGWKANFPKLYVNAPITVVYRGKTHFAKPELQGSPLGSCAFAAVQESWSSLCSLTTLRFGFMGSAKVAYLL